MDHVREYINNVEDVYFKNKLPLDENRDITKHLSFDPDPLNFGLSVFFHVYL